ncbi:hypothetical protein U9M48_041480, partial [Paspalum notatum var. saurae]
TALHSKQLRVSLINSRRIATLASRVNLRSRTHSQTSPAGWSSRVARPEPPRIYLEGRPQRQRTSRIPCVSLVQTREDLGDNRREVGRRWIRPNDERGERWRWVDGCLPFT